MFRNAIVRYLFGIAAVACALVLRIWLIPLTGSGAPFTLFFAAILVTSWAAGVGPGILTLLLSLLLGAYMFAVGRGYSISQAAFHGLLFAADGTVVVYLTHLMAQSRAVVQEANRELRNANEEMTRAEARTRELIELAPEAFFLANLEACFTDVNQAACQMLGYDRSELLSKTIFDIIPAEDAARLEKVRTTLLEPGQVEKGEWTHIRKDGTFVPVLMSANILSDGRWQAFVRDITLRKRAEAREHQIRLELELANDQLRESEERFRLTVDEAPIGMALVALDGHVVRVNRGLCEIIGYSADELTKMTFQAITHPDDLEVDVALAGQLARGEIAQYQLGKRYIRKNGSIVDIMFSVSILRDRNGKPRYYISRIEDISERKRAEEALRMSEAKFSGIVAIAADAIITVDKDQRITIFNEGAERIFGYSKTDMIGKPLDILIPERLHAVHREHFARFAASHETAGNMAERQEVFGVRKNGEEFPAEASISKVTVNGVTFFSVVLRDITLRKNSEQALQRAVASRDQVLGIVVHDLRNPLSNIILACSNLRRRSTEPERRNQKPIETISRAASRMNHLIQDLLDVMLVEAGQLKIATERFSVEDLVLEAVETQASLASASGVAIRLAVTCKTHDFFCDRERLLRVFENLIGNAVKFTTPGGQVTVGADSRDYEVLFWVTDTGCGITPENLPHIFDRFWQATSRTGRLGAGLGLPITKGIVEAHRGRIWVESAVGRGSTFFFTIPKAPQTKVA